MDNDPGFLSRLFDFGWALLPYWWLLVTGFIFAVEPMIEALLPGNWREAVNRHWSKEKRQLHFRWASLMAVLIASFLAFDDVSKRNRALQTSVTTVIGERDEARRQRDRNVSPAINSLSGDLAVARGQIDQQRDEIGRLKKDLEMSRQPWTMKDDMRSALATEIAKVPEGERFKVVFWCSQDTNSRTFLEDFGKVFKDHKWDVSANCLFNNMRAGIRGIWITFKAGKEKEGKPVNFDEVPGDAVKMGRIFNAARIPFSWGLNETLKDGEWYVGVGIGPNN